MTTHDLKSKDIGYIVKVSVVVQQMGLMFDAYGCNHTIE